MMVMVLAIRGHPRAITSDKFVITWLVQNKQGSTFTVWSLVLPGRMSNSQIKVRGRIKMNEIMNSFIA